MKLKSLFSPHSLRIQLLSRSLLILAILLVLIGLLQYIFMRDVVYQSKALSMQSQIQSIPPPAWKQFTGREEDNDFRRPPRVFIAEFSLVFIDRKGNYSLLSAGHEQITPPHLDKQEYLSRLKPSRHKGPPHYLIANAGGAEQLVVLQPVFSGPGQVMGLVQTSTPTAPLKELLIRQLLTFILLALVALFIGSLAYLPVLKRTLVPLANMVDTAEQIDAGHLDQRFPIQQGQAEIDRLADSCNGMLERLEASFAAELETKEQMRRFVADASHELRTPLTSIHGFLEVLLRGAAHQPEQLERSLQSMHSESLRLNKLVHDLLLLTKLDREAELELSEGCLDSLIQEMEPQLRILAGHRKLDIQTEAEIECRYEADKMKQVILNLFQNAVQHTDPDKGHIQISIVKVPNGVLLSVKDNGPGIAADHLPHIFERFYRSDSSRTRKYGGAGLGLAISQSIVEAHGGKISVSSQEGEGCLFKVWLPRASGHDG